MVGAAPDMDTMREQVCRICSMIYARQLSDSAGGNLSVRVGDCILATPRYTGSKRRWQLEPADLLLLDSSGTILEGSGSISREYRMHLDIYGAFERAGAVIHAHPQYAMVYASACKPVPATSEQTAKFGDFPLVREAPSHSAGLAESVVETLRDRADQLDQHGLGCILPHHGVTVVGRDLDDAYDVLERLEGCARISLFKRLLE